MKLFCSFAALAVACLVAGNAQIAGATTIESSSTNEIVTVADIDLTAGDLARINFGAGAEGAGTDVTVTTRVFKLENQGSGPIQDVSNSAALGYGGGATGVSTGNADLDAVLKNIAYNGSSGSSFTVTMAGLTIGQEYKVQLLHAERFGLQTPARVATIDLDGTDVFTDFNYWTEQGSLVTKGSRGVINFKPTATSAVLTYTSHAASPGPPEVLAGNNPMISGLILTQVPEPSSFALAGLSLVGLIGSVRRRRNRA